MNGDEVGDGTRDPQCTQKGPRHGVRTGQRGRGAASVFVDMPWLLGGVPFARDLCLSLEEAMRRELNPKG